MEAHNAVYVEVHYIVDERFQREARGSHSKDEHGNDYHNFEKAVEVGVQFDLKRLIVLMDSVSPAPQEVEAGHNCSP